MKLLELLETYTDELSYLMHYLRSEPLDLAGYKYELVEFLRDGKLTPEQEAMFPENTDHNTELDYDMLEKLEDSFSESQKREFVHQLMRDDPANAPSWAYLSFIKLLPRTTWLIHKTDDNNDIRRNGFVYGTDEVDRLGLTSWYKKSSKHRGGYNFAFEANGNFNESAYGEHAVMFQSAAVLCYHSGDNENQAIFWGPSVNPKSVIMLDKVNDEEYDWVARTYSGKVLVKGDLDKCIGWVMRNADSYRKTLDWRP